MKVSRNPIVVALLAATALSHIGGVMSAEKGLMTSSADIVWDGPTKIARLWGNRDLGAYGMLLKLPLGFESGFHAHTADYNAINLQGTWAHTMDGEIKELAPGSYVMQPGGQLHNDACKGPAECILFIQQNSKGDFIPAEASK